MDTAGIDGNYEVRARSVAIQTETEGVLTGHVETANGVPRSLSPLVNSMRSFGLYFTRTPRVCPATTSEQTGQCVGACQGWNRARIYATVMLVIIWLNAVRNIVIFDGSEMVGADLVSKLGTIPGVLLIAVLHTTYYVASHTGSLDRIFRQMNLSTPDFSVKYSRRAKMLTVVAWILTAMGFIYYSYLTFSTVGLNDYSLLLIIKTFPLSNPHATIIKVVCSLLQLQAIVSWAFTQAMKYTSSYGRFLKQ